MTDEETDIENGGLIQRSPKWRSNNLSTLLTKLDEKYSRTSRQNP